VIRTVPSDTPVTTPEAMPTVAISVLPLCHVPPGVGLLSVIVYPTQTDVAPVVAALMVMALVAAVVPQSLATE